MRVLRFCSFLLVTVSLLCGSVFAQNDLLVTSYSGSSIARFDAETGENLGNFIESGSGGLSAAAGVAVGSDGNVYVTSQNTSQVLRYNGQTGEFIDVFASGTRLTGANNIEFHGDHMFVGNFATGTNGRINRFDASTGDFVDAFIQSNNIDGFTFLSDSILVSSFSNNSVNRYNLETGAFIEVFASAGEGGLSTPTDILELENGEVLIGSYNTNTIKRFSADGDFLGDAITNLNGPEGLAIGPNGSLYAGSFNGGFVNEYDAETFEFQRRFATVGGNTNFFTFRTASVPEPSSLAILAAFGSFSLLSRRRRSSSV